MYGKNIKLIYRVKLQKNLKFNQLFKNVQFQQTPNDCIRLLQLFATITHNIVNTQNSEKIQTLLISY